MNTRSALPILLIAALLCAGCNPTKQYIVATEAYSQTLALAVEKRKAGEMTDSQYRRVEAVRVIAAQILDRWRDALATGDQFRLAGIAGAFADALAALKEAGGLK